ncbi:MAG: (Fe-S)-binding protein [Candidatus Helarchaeota archaeon]|nr:(Fe-S)-binding protein [Candidatus Helarchaeota archaeon]
MSSKLKDIEIDILKCARCGTCRSICPTLNDAWGENGPTWETTGPRGRVLMSYGLQKNKIKPSKKMVQDIFNCLICNRCVEVCPSGVDTTKIIQATRKEILDQNLTPIPLSKLHEILEKNKNIYGLDQEDRLLWTEMNIEDIVEDRILKKAEVAFFVGCQGSFRGSLFGIPEAIVLLLEKLKIDYTILGEEEWCCGSPFYLVGDDSKTAKEFVIHNIEKMLELGVKKIIFTCPGCYRAWKHVYPKLYGKELPFELSHSTEFITKLIEEGKIKFDKEIKKKVGYQDPCELGRHCNIYEEPRKIIKKIPGVIFKELKENRKESLCCGGGGLAKVTDNEISLGIGSKKLKDFLENDIDIILTCCPACYQNLIDALGITKEDVEILDLHEFLIQALNLA